MGGKRSIELFVAYSCAIAAGELRWALYIAPLLASVPSEGLLLIIQRRGFGRRGFGFGRRGGSFGLFRILFALLFAFVAYRFFTSRRRR